MKPVFPPEWRTQTRWKRRFYASYMRTLERAGYVLVFAVFAAFVAAFNVQVEDVASADKVTIAPFATPLAVAGPTLVVRTLAEDFGVVHKGQPLAEVVVGADAIRAYRAWQAVQGLLDEPGLAARYPRPQTVSLAAPRGGTFRLEAKEAAVLEDKAALGRIVDYADLRVETSLSGDTVPQARAESPARIVNVAVEPVAGTVFRGGGIVSGKALGEGVKATLNQSLVGRGVRLRDDVPLVVKEVSEVQVDSPLAAGGNAPADPPADLTVAARVVEGAPSATVQVADLPDEVADAARTAARAALERDGVKVDPKDLRFVVKLKAGDGNGAGGALPGTMLSRSYDAKLRLIDPPKSLVDAVREADAAGRKVTCRVELVTGRRPIALRLLKKS